MSYERKEAIFMENFDENVQNSVNEHCGEANNSKASKVGYFMGQLSGAVLCACAIAAVVALTTKFIFWLF
jgi:hypothetical protein